MRVIAFLFLRLMLAASLVESVAQDHDATLLPQDAYRRFITAEPERRGPFIQSRRMILSPNGRFLAVPDYTKKIRLWNVETGKEVLTIKRLFTSISRIIFSPDGNKLASLCYDNTTSVLKYTIQLWEIATGKELAMNEWDHSTRYSMPFSPDGKILASGSEIGAIHLWDTETGKERQTLQGLALEGSSNAINAIAFSPDGKLLASVDEVNKTIRMWEVASGKEIRRIQGGGASVVFSPDGTKVASWERMLGPAIRLWEISSGKELPSLGQLGQLMLPSFSSLKAVIFSPNGRSLMSVYDSRNVKGGLEHSWVFLWDVTSGNKLSEIDGSQQAEISGAFTSEDRALALEVQAGKSQTIRLWDVAARKVIKQIEGNRQFPLAIFSPDKRIFATSNKDDAIRLWDVTDGRLVKQFKGHQDHIDAMVFSVDGKTLASASADGTILVWKVE